MLPRIPAGQPVNDVQCGVISGGDSVFDYTIAAKAKTRERVGERRLNLTSPAPSQRSPRVSGELFADVLHRRGAQPRSLRSEKLKLGQRAGAGRPGRCSAAGGGCARIMARRDRAGRPGQAADDPENFRVTPRLSERSKRIEPDKIRFLSGSEFYLRSFDVIVFSSGLYVRL